MDNRLQNETLMRCTSCDQAERSPVRRAKMAERDGHVAVVTGVPMEECSACGDRWMTEDVAVRLDEILRRLLASGAETATAHWEELTPSAA